MEQSKETSSESNDYEIIDELTNTPEILSYTSSMDQLSPPSEISDKLSPDNLSLTLSPLQNITPPQSPLYQSILEGCEEAGITSDSKPDKEEKEKEKEKEKENNKCILCRILQFIKFLFTTQHLPLTDDNYSSYHSHYPYI